MNLTIPVKPYKPLDPAAPKSKRNLEKAMAKLFQTYSPGAGNR